MGLALTLPCSVVYSGRDVSAAGHCVTGVSASRWGVINKLIVIYYTIQLPGHTD